MASYISAIFLAFVATSMISQTVGQAAGPPAVIPWIPPHVANAPWMPQWSPCTVVGTSCQDCSTKLVCTKVGGLVKPCTNPAFPHCNMGQCTATPSAECGAV